MVGVETAKLKSANIILCATRDNVMHAVAFLAPSCAPLHKLYMKLFCKFVNSWLCSSASSERRHHAP